MSFSSNRNGFLLFMALAACLIYGVLFLFIQPVVKLPLPDQKDLILWQDFLFYRFRLLLIAVGVTLFLLAIAGHYAYKFKHREYPISSSPEKLLHCLMPLSFLPIAAVILLLADILPQEVLSNSVFFIPVFVFSLIVSRLLAGFISKESNLKNEKEWGLVIFIISTLFYASLGYHIAEITGEQAGDECHYLIQTISLYEDHDLDVKNNWINLKEENTPQTVTRYNDALHISPNSRGAHCYSWHPWGLPLILAPIFGLGMLARYLMLGMIASLGNVAMYKISRGVGASPNASLVAVLSFGISFYWALYSARVYPEVLGATLLCWLFWAILCKRKRPWLTLFCGSFCCIYLPMAHLRFLPLSLIGAGFFCMHELYSQKNWRQKIFRLAIFSILCLLGYGIYFVSQYLMYERGVAYPANVFWSFPLGMWGTIAGSLGLVSILPAFMWMCASFFGWLILSHKNRLYAISILATFMACLLISCSNKYYFWRTCVPGRYLVVVAPLLIPGAAYMLQRTSSVGRWWLFFLSIISTSLLIMALFCLPAIGDWFVVPVHSLSNSYPILSCLYHPHSSFLFTSTLVSHLATAIYVIGGIILTAVILLVPEKKKKYSILLVLAICVLGAAAHAVRPQDFKRSKLYDQRRLGEYLSLVKLETVYVPTKMNKPTNLFDISKVVFPDFVNATSVVGVTTSDLGVRVKDRLISQPNLEVNDWALRGYRWATLTAPRTPTEGWRILHIEGVLEGTAIPLFAIREGAETIYEGTLDVIDQKINENIAFYCKGKRGHLYVLLHLSAGSYGKEGEGSFYLKEFYWSPYHDNLIKDTNLYIPGKLSMRDGVWHRVYPPQI